MVNLSRSKDFTNVNLLVFVLVGASRLCCSPDGENQVLKSDQRSDDQQAGRPYRSQSFTIQIYRRPYLKYSHAKRPINNTSTTKKSPRIKRFPLRIAM